MRVSNKMPFIVAAYNKDAGRYDDVHTTPSEAMAMRVGKSLAALVKTDSYRDPVTHEPYDWITIFHGDEGVLVTAD